MSVDLPAPLTLALFRGDRLLFSSGGRWLHPLFELEEAARAGLDLTGTRLVDRVTGRGAAFLVARLGVRDLATGVLSRRAAPVLEAHGVQVRADQVVDRIACATEDLLAEVTGLEAAWRLLAERRARALAGGRRPA